MKISSITIALTGAILAGAAPSLAFAADATPSAVHLDAVRIQRSYGIHDKLFPGLVSVSFTNTASVAVAEVDFALEHADGSYIDEIQDVGPFAPGASVKHNFPDIHTSTKQKLVVDSITFADGTKWSAPDTSPPITISAPPAGD